MGLFSRRKKNKRAEAESAYKWMTLEEALSYSKGERRASEDDIVKLMDETCKQLVSLKRQQENTKKEYSAVTDYLTDIQKLDSIPDNERMEIDDAARTIINLENDRINYQSGDRKLQSVEFRMLTRYEEEIPGVIKELEEKERYLLLVQEDMRQLEGEKGSIKYEKDDAVSKKKFLHKFSYIVIGTVVTVFIILLLLMGYTGKDFTVPFFITGVAAIAYTAYYLVISKKLTIQSHKSDLAMKRAIELLNKVKLKYVNTKSVLDYLYEKYEVNSHHELVYRWECYVRAREEEKRYRKSSQLLVSYQNMLVELLARRHIASGDMWIHQPEALIDRREMTEVRHSLNERRRKLRAQIDFNIRQQDVSMNEIEALKNKYSEYAGLITSIMKEYRIE